MLPPSTASYLRTLQFAKRRRFIKDRHKGPFASYVSREFLCAIRDALHRCGNKAYDGTLSIPILKSTRQDSWE